MSVEAVPLPGAERTSSTADAWWVFPAVPLFAAAVAFTWTLSGGLARIYGMTGSAWDLAYFQQVIWNVSQGKGFYSSFARGDYLGIHLELIFLLLAAVEKLWPSPTVLLIFSSAGLAATAPAAYLFFRALLPADHAESPWLAIALSVPLPFWAAMQEAARDFFHSENLALGFALFAAWAGIRGRRVLMWLFIVLDLACKEDQAYTVAVIAILMSANGAPQVKKHWRLILYVAAAWLLIGAAITGFRDYASLVSTDPLTLVQAVVLPDALLVVAGIIASMFALPVLAPRWLLLAIPPYLANAVSAHAPQNTLRLHYVLLVMFPLIVAGGIGARRFLEIRSIKPAIALGAMLPALILGYGAGRFPPALGAEASLYEKPNAVAELRQATVMIPADAPVNADDGLTVWLANRHTINAFPDRLDGSCYVVIDSDPYLGDPTNAAQRNKIAATLPTSGRRLLYDDGRLQVWSPVGD
jgi:uncharacterized membrane protein